MHFARPYENRTLLAVRSKRVIAQKLKSRKNITYSVVNLQKRGEISGVSTHHATYGWRHLVIEKRGSTMRLADPPSIGWLSLFASLSGSKRTLYALFKYSTLLRQSVLFFMRTIFDPMIISHLFTHSPCAVLVFPATPHSHSPRWQSPLYFSCWTVLDLRAAFDSIFSLL